ncbi:hypothetical protein ACFL1G_08020 [Planctomycetota bacterium]
MDTEQRPNVSVIDPIGPAITRVKEILFKPFDLTKWFVIGFCAWLAGLGEGGGGGGNFNFNVPQRGEAHHMKEAIIENLPWIIPAAIIGFIVFLAIGIVICWLSSRGRFMFLHCVAENKAEVKVPWDKFQQQGNSLFIFRLVVGIIAFICIAVLIGLMIFFIILISESKGSVIAPIVVGLIFVILLIIAVSIFTGLLMKFTKDFVVPIMFLGPARCIDGWRKFLRILSINKARFALYILFQIVIGMAIGGIVLAAVFLTCCTACCFLAIPYIGTVLMLPVLIFKRAYSVCYLSQFGPEFDVLRNGQMVVDANVVGGD